MVIFSNYLHRIILAVIVLLFALPHAATAQQTTNPHPNIIFFLVDDMGWEDSSVPFWDSRVRKMKNFILPTW